MKKRTVIAVATLASLVLAVGCNKENEAAEAAAQAPAAPGSQATFPVEAPDSLRALATVPLDSARVLALGRVPNSTVRKVELEREDGVLIWSFDIQVAGQEGISEVKVNALSGAVSPVEREGPAAEAEETREDSSVRHPTAPPRRP